eukprot:5981754-Karenia_brevis.AAC.1
MDPRACVTLMRMASTRSGDAHMIMITMSTLFPHVMNVPPVTLLPVVKIAIGHPSMTLNVI